MNIGTSSNTVFVVRFAHPNGFGTSQTPKTLGEIALNGKNENVSVSNIFVSLS